MRILMLNYEFPPLGGGASPVSFEIAEGLSRHGCIIDVVTMSYKGLPKKESINDKFSIYRVKCLRRKKELCHFWEQATYLFSGYFKCKELLKKKKYDICHCHFIIPTGILAYLLKKKYNLNYVITSHGSDVPGFNPDRFIFLHKFSGFILRRVCSRAKCIISPSKYLESLILKNIDRQMQRKIVNIPNGIEKNKFQFYPERKRKYIISTGRLLERKGFQYLIQAVSDKDIGYEVHICGDGPMMEKLKTMAKKCKTKIIFHGWIDNKSREYKELLERAAIYVLASERENASVALLEGMCAGCAVVTTNISGCPETIDDAGLLFKSKNISELKKALTCLINNEHKLKHYQKIARERIENCFDWNIVLSQYLKQLHKNQ